MSVEERVRELIAPVVERTGLRLYDTEVTSGLLRVTVDRDAGVDLDAIGDVSQRISRLLDDEEIISDAKYILEVSSPGIERRLRHVEHYEGAVGETVRIRLRVAVAGSRRLDGRLVSADDSGIELEVDGESRLVAYPDISDARTVFDWDGNGPGDQGVHDRTDSPQEKEASAP